MELHKLKLKNFRSYSRETEITISDINVIIGKNDLVKCTILAALDIFFNRKPDIKDFCKSNDDSPIEITCVFEDLPESLILDDLIETSLKDEFLLNAGNKLEIKRKFLDSETGSISEETFIISEYPDNDNLRDLLSKEWTTLILQFEELNINPEGVNRTKRKELRTAIRNHFYADGKIKTVTTEIKLDGKLDKENNRIKLWAALKKYLPVCLLSED